MSIVGRLSIVVALALGALVLSIPPRVASAADLSIPIDTFIDAQQFTTVPLGSFDSSAVAGQTCTVSSVGVNQESVHAGNNLIASSGGGSVTMFDVEGSPNKTSMAAGTLTMGSTVNLSVYIGNDDSGTDGGITNGFFSGGMNVEFECTPNEPPPPPPPADINLCHANGDGTYTFVGPLTQAEVDQLHPVADPAHADDIIPAPEGGCPAPPPPPPPPPPEPIELCHANDDGTYTLEGPFSPAEAQQLHGGHAGDIIPAPEGGCPAQPPPPPEPIDVCHSNGDGTYTIEGPFTPAEAEELHGDHPDDIIPAPEGGCATPVVQQAELTVGGLAPVCIEDTPFIAYAIVTELDATSAEITLTDVNGVVVAEYPNAPLTGTLIWPGASVDPEDWPGWRIADNGNWEPDPTDAHLRQGLLVTATINPTGSGSVTYPPATEVCADPPVTRTSDQPQPAAGGGTSSNAPSGGLPVTGSGSTVAILLAALALIAGGFFLMRSARTAEQPQD